MSGIGLRARIVAVLRSPVVTGRIPGTSVPVPVPIVVHTTALLVRIVGTGIATIDDPVVIQVTQGHGARLITDPIAQRLLDRAIPQAQQDAHYDDRPRPHTF